MFSEFDSEFLLSSPGSWNSLFLVIQYDFMQFVQSLKVYNIFRVKIFYREVKSAVNRFNFPDVPEEHHKHTFLAGRNQKTIKFNRIPLIWWKWKLAPCFDSHEKKWDQTSGSDCHLRGILSVLAVFRNSQKWWLGISFNSWQQKAERHFLMPLINLLSGC